MKQLRPARCRYIHTAPRIHPTWNYELLRYAAGSRTPFKYLIQFYVNALKQCKIV